MAKQWDTSPEMSIDEGKVYQVKLETSRGDIQLELFSGTRAQDRQQFYFPDWRVLL